MTTLRIELDEAVAAAIRQKAELEGKSPEAWVAAVAAQQASAAPNKEWITRFLESAKQSQGDSKGWKWNREELYDR